MSTTLEVLQTRNKLTATRSPELRDELIALSTEPNEAGESGFRSRSEYLIVLARKRT